VNTIDASEIIDMNNRTEIAVVICTIARPQGYIVGMWDGGDFYIGPHFPQGDYTKGMVQALVDYCPAIEIQIGRNEEQTEDHIWFGHRGKSKVPTFCFPLSKHPATGQELFTLWTKGKGVPRRPLGSWLKDVSNLWVQAVKQGLSNLAPAVEDMHEQSGYDAQYPLSGLG
jgi:hypothetical protein